MSAELTPLMKQYYEIKNSHPETLLLFQVGDFYELFFDDAQTAAAFLGITLTKRGKINGEPIPLCGIPVHTLDHYLAKLVRGGFKVAICDQLEPAVPGRTVQRGVTQVLTPGTLTDPKLLDAKSASYLFSFFPQEDHWGLLFGELLTAQLFATVVPAASEKTLEAELVRFFPDEVLIPSNKLGKQLQPHFNRLGFFTSFETIDLQNAEIIDSIDQWTVQQFNEDAVNMLGKHGSLKGALYNFYSYVNRTQQSALSQFKRLQLYNPEDFLLIDPATQKNLELIKNNQDGGRNNTLVSLMDKATTPMGSRMVKKWIMRPLVKREAIDARLDVVQDFVVDVTVMQKLAEQLRLVGDLERIIGRIALKRAQAQDYVTLAKALAVLPEIKSSLVSKTHLGLVKDLMSAWGDYSALQNLLQVALNDDLAQEWIIKPGFDQALDQLRELIATAHQKILAFEQQEQQRTGINSLKVGYTNVFGYYIEITKTHFDRVPEHYMRLQTLVGRERFMTHELQELQQKIVHAKSQIALVEQQIFERIKSQVNEYVGALRRTAQAVANLDALFGFALLAYCQGYARPTFNEQRDISIVGGRHPVVEQTLSLHFIPNNTTLCDAESTWIITGPNMGGKSTYLRQVGLINLMAQCGSMVPAEQANLPILDRIFTRIGAGDNLADGKSTFLVEMEETALICTQATRKSLVILDEVGRGTSTFDGLAIAQAVVEYIHTTIGARCLFATHYHELTALQNHFPGIVPYHAASKKTATGIMFLYKILKGVADGSFGIEVAKLAHLPPVLIARACAILPTLGLPGQVTVRPAEVLAQGVAESPGRSRVMEELQAIDLDNLTPKQAFDALWRLKNLPD